MREASTRETRRREFLRRMTIAASAGIIGGLAGCGGGGGDAAGGGNDDTTRSPTSSPTPTPEETQQPTTEGMETPTPTPTSSNPSAQEAYPDYKWGKLDGASPTATTTVTLKNTAFHPLIAKVPKGKKITFTNEDGYGHSVTIPKLGIDRNLSGGASTTVTFETTGTFGYVCTFHPPTMLGRLVVAEDVQMKDGSGTTSTPTKTDGGGYGGGY